MYPFWNPKNQNFLKWNKTTWIIRSTQKFLYAYASLYISVQFMSVEKLFHYRNMAFIEEHAQNYIDMLLILPVHIFYIQIEPQFKRMKMK